MEVMALSISIATVVFTIAFSIFSLFKPKSDINSKLPPGSLGWPIIGETIEFLFGKPEKFVAYRMKKYSPEIFKTRILGEKTAVICGPNGNKFLFSNEQKIFTSFLPHAAQRLFRSYQPKTGAIRPVSVDQRSSISDEARRIARQPGFLKPEALARFLGKMESIMRNLLQVHLEGQEDVIKVFPLAKTITLAISCKFFLGNDIDPERVARLVDRFDDVTNGVHSIMVDFPGTIYNRANKAAAEIRTELVEVIREKKAAMVERNLMEDLLFHIISVTDATGKTMPEAEIADKIMGMITAGYSTVATAITFLMKYVGERSDIYNRIRAEQMEIAASKKAGEFLEWEDTQKMKYSWTVICETMRLTPPLQGTFREALTDFSYAGYTIPKGWRVYWSVSTTNTNPTYFKDPDKFDPSRYDSSEEGEGLAPYTYVPFGGGPRLCPGKDYARLVILAFLHNMVKNYKWEVLFPNENIVGDMMPIPEKGLPIRLQPASS